MRRSVRRRCRSHGTARKGTFYGLDGESHQPDPHASDGLGSTIGLGAVIVAAVGTVQMLTVFGEPTGEGLGGKDGRFQAGYH